jgi:hypothetical protein
MQFLQDLLAQLGVPQQWIIVIVVFLLGLWVGVKWKGSNDEGEMKALRAQTDLAKDQKAQYQQLANQAGDQERKIADLELKFADLRKSLAERASPTTVNQLLDRIASDTGAIATANSSTQKIVRALLGYGYASGVGTATAHGQSVSRGRGSTSGSG